MKDESLDWHFHAPVRGVLAASGYKDGHPERVWLQRARIREDTGMELYLDELEAHNFWGRTHSGRVYTIGDKWVFVDGDRDSAQAFATLLEPVGNQGWTVVIEKRSRQDEYSWGPSVVGVGLGLTYAEAEQVAYIFHTEGEVAFDFHQGIALSISGGVEFCQVTAMLSERYDDRRSVYFKKEGSGWFATGVSEMWSERIASFVRRDARVRFPEQGHDDLETVRALAYEWAIQPALADTERASAWWRGRCPDKVPASKVTYLSADRAA